MRGPSFAAPGEWREPSELAAQLARVMAWLRQWPPDDRPHTLAMVLEAAGCPPLPAPGDL